jgi:tryptophanyl-tRNA synthetase
VAKRVLTGVKPTGTPHVGNYLGAIRPALELAKNNESFLFIADLHALTTSNPNPKLLNEQIYVVAATWLALGLDPKKTVFYRQLDVPEITNLAWLLSCVLPIGMLERAHSFKDAQGKGLEREDVKHGLYSYPVLMAADILLFDADQVPVGKDQKQHLEIAQEAARKFNNLYQGNYLKIPEALIDEAVMTIPGTDGQKMSKSYNNTIEPFADDKALRKIVKAMKTNSTEYGQPLDPKGDAVFEIHKLIAAPEATAALLRRYESGRKDPSGPNDSANYFGWGDAKNALADELLAHFAPARAEYLRLMADRPYIDRLLKEGAERARTVATKTLDRCYRATGLLPPTP